MCIAGTACVHTMEYNPAYDGLLVTSNMSVCRLITLKCTKIGQLFGEIALSEGVNTGERYLRMES